MTITSELKTIIMGERVQIIHRKTYTGMNKKVQTDTNVYHIQHGWGSVMPRVFMAYVMNHSNATGMPFLHSFREEYEQDMKMYAERKSFESLQNAIEGYNAHIERVERLNIHKPSEVAEFIRHHCDNNDGCMVIEENVWWSGISRCTDIKVGMLWNDTYVSNGVLKGAYWTPDRYMSECQRLTPDEDYANHLRGVRAIYNQFAQVYGIEDLTSEEDETE